MDEWCMLHEMVVTGTEYDDEEDEEEEDTEGDDDCDSEQNDIFVGCASGDEAGDNKGNTLTDQFK